MLRTPVYLLPQDTELISPLKGPSIQAVQVTFTLQWPLIITVPRLPVYYGERGTKLVFPATTSNFSVRNYLKAWGWRSSVLQKCLLTHRWHHDYISVNKKGFLIWLFSDILQIKKHFPSLQTQIPLTEGTAFMSGNLYEVRHTICMPFAWELALETFEYNLVYTHLQPLLRCL